MYILCKSVNFSTVLTETYKVYIRLKKNYAIVFINLFFYADLHRARECRNFLSVLYLFFVAPLKERTGSTNEPHYFLFYNNSKRNIEYLSILSFFSI